MTPSPLLQTIQRAIATLFGVGRLPKAPGTWGSLATVLILWPVAAMTTPLDPSLAGEISQSIGRIASGDLSGPSRLTEWVRATGLFPTMASFGLWVAILGGSLLSLWTTRAAEAAWGEDPPRMVIDEWAGQAIPLLGLPLSGSIQTDFLWLLGAFLLFRFFDIIKPLGVDRAQQLPSGFGILVDDLLAGFYAWICLQVILWLV